MYCDNSVFMALLTEHKGRMEILTSKALPFQIELYSVLSSHLFRI